MSRWRPTDVGNGDFLAVFDGMLCSQKRLPSCEAHGSVGDARMITHGQSLVQKYACLAGVYVGPVERVCLDLEQCEYGTLLCDVQKGTRSQGRLTLHNISLAMFSSSSVSFLPL